MRQFAILSMCCLVAGCGQGSNIRSSPYDDASIKTRIENLETRTRETDNRLFGRMAKDSFSAWLQPDDTGYSPLETPIGRITVQMTAVKPYADGSQIILRVGNPLGATVGQMKVDLEYGQLDKNQAPIESTTREVKGRSIELNIAPATWHDVSVNLPGVTPSKLSYLSLSNAQSVTMAMPVR